MIHNPECFIKCKGRDVEGNEVLKEPLRVKIQIRLSEDHHTGRSTIIIGAEECPHNVGEYHELCKASGPAGKDVFCVYTVEVPGVKDRIAKLYRTGRLK